jgi:hypothetical protein
VFLRFTFRETVKKEIKKSIKEKNDREIPPPSPPPLELFLTKETPKKVFTAFWNFPC